MFLSRRLVLLLACVAVLAAAPAARQAAPAPVVVFETAKGVFEIEFFPQDAPKSVAHLVGLVEKRFYRGQRIHRVTASLVQFGDPQTRDMTRRDYWRFRNARTPAASPRSRTPGIRRTPTASCSFSRPPCRPTTASTRSSAA